MHFGVLSLVQGTGRECLGGIDKIPNSYFCMPDITDIVLGKQ